MMNTLLEKLNQNKMPKRILSLDGGGIKGVFSLGILKEIERLVKQKYGADTTLGQYYDLISGTSTGAIIASGLAIGKSVDEMIELYLNLGGEIFGKGRKWKIIPRDWTMFRAIFNESYSSTNLEEYLKKEFGENTTIGDTEKIQCGLAINCKRADTYSLWTVANHPDGKYFNANSHLKLWELCRASSAAPYYFKPKILQLKTRQGKAFEAAFIDGGVSLANNPAWMAFLTATVGSFGFKWTTGVDNIHIVTIGTGKGIKKEKPDELANSKAVSWASKIAELFMTDALELNQVLLDGIGKNVGKSYFVDSQFSDPTYPPPFNTLPQLFSFERHNIDIYEKNLSDLGFSFAESKIESFIEMDHFENMKDLLQIGEAYAQNNKFNLI